MRYLAFAMLIILCISSVYAAADTTKLTVMSYNVEYGAGVNPAEARIAEKDSNGKDAGNRLNRMLAVIEYVNPDILGIEEACSWDKDHEAVAKQVAKELGMHYYLAKSGQSRFNVALFSKLPIVSATGFPDRFTRAALQANLALPDGRTLCVFVAHFNLLRAEESQLSEIRYLAEQMRAYTFSMAVMMGDCNFKYGVQKDSTKALLASGFVVAPQVGKRIDQIWTSRPLVNGVAECRAIPTAMTDGTSDHRPIVASIVIPNK